MPLYIVDTWREQFSLPGKQATVYDTYDAAAKISGPLEVPIQTVYTHDELQGVINSTVASAVANERLECTKRLENAIKADRDYIKEKLASILGG